MKTFRRYVTGCFLTAMLVLIVYPYAYAFDGIQSCTHRGHFGTCGKESGHCNQKNYLYDAQGRSSLLVNEYTRSGNRIVNLESRYDQQGVSFTVQATAICGGESSGGIRIGEWSMLEHSGGVCWDRHVLMSPENCVGQTLGEYFDMEPVNLTAVVLGQCGEGCCVVDDDENNMSITGSTGDDMMAMFDEREAYHEFKQGVCDDVHWISRMNKPGPNNPLMIPSKCPDYERFIQAKSGGAISVEPACRPSLVKLCGIEPKPPKAPVDKGCGVCQQTYAQLFPDREFETGGNVCARWEVPSGMPYNIVKAQCSDLVCRLRDNEGNCRRCVPYFREFVVQHTICNCGTEEVVNFPYEECSNDC